MGTSGGSWERGPSPRFVALRLGSSPKTLLRADRLTGHSRNCFVVFWGFYSPVLSCAGVKPFVTPIHRQGGNNFSSIRDFMTDLYGVTSMDESAQRIVQVSVLSSTTM